MQTPRFKTQPQQHYFDRSASRFRVSAELAALDQAARLTLRLVERIDMVSLRFSERQRLAKILLRLERISGEAHDILPLVPSKSDPMVPSRNDSSLS